MCMQMTHLEGFLQEQTGVSDGLLSTPCTVRCNHQGSVRRARKRLCAQGADHLFADHRRCCCVLGRVVACWGAQCLRPARTRSAQAVPRTCSLRSQSRAVAIGSQQS